MRRKTPKILFFLADGVPTDAELDAGEKCGFGVVFRNSQYVPVEGALEACDGVAGNVPPRYAEAFPVERDGVFYPADVANEAPVAPVSDEQAPANTKAPVAASKAPEAAPVPPATPPVWKANA